MSIAPVPVTPVVYHPGDLVFCHSTGFVGGGIRWAERVRRDWDKTNESTGAKYNHVAILDAPLPNGDWTVIQAVGAGVVQDTPERPSRLSTVAPGGFYSIVPLPDDVSRSKVLEFARSQVGYQYGFITDACIAVTLLTPKFFNIMLPHTWICSAVAAESLRAGGWIHDWPDVYQVTPAQLWLALQEKAA